MLERDCFSLCAASGGSGNAAAGIEQQQTCSSSSSDCQRQMKSEAFRGEKNPGRSSVCRARRVAAVCQLHSVVDREASGLALELMCCNDNDSDRKRRLEAAIFRM